MIELYARRTVTTSLNAETRPSFRANGERHREVAVTASWRGTRIASAGERGLCVGSTDRKR
jgi:hypothetical protein